MALSTDKIPFGEFLKEATSALKESQAPANFGLTKKTVYKYSDNTYTEQRTLVSSRKLKASEDDFLTKLKDVIAKRVTEAPTESTKRLKALTFEVGLDLGDEMIPVDGLERLTFKEENTHEAVDATYTHEQGVVTLVDFWVNQNYIGQATWCGPCQGPMQHNEDMLKKNEESWKGKAKIVAISLDDEQEKLTKRINDKDWKRIDHYRMKEGWDSENKAMQQFDIDGIPFVTLLDKEGKIVFKGHPSECKIEDEINRLIAAPPSQVQDGPLVQEEPAPNQDKAHYLKAKEFLRTQWKAFLESNKITKFEDYFDLALQKTSHYNQDGKKSKQERGKLQVSYKITNGIDLAKQGVQLVEQLPTESYTVTKAIFNDPKQEYLSHLKFLKEVAERNSLSVEFIVEETSTRVITKTSVFSTQEKVTQAKSLPPSLGQAQQEISGELQKYLQANRETNIRPFQDIFRAGFNFSLAVGDQFAEIGNVHGLGKSEIAVIQHKAGQVLIVDFWAVWCGPCVGGLDKNSHLIEKNKAAWDGKVRFVAISLEGEADSKDIFAKKPEWPKYFEFFFMKDGKKNPAPSTYGVRYIPHYVIVGKDGKVRTLGSCNNLEETINKLLAEEAQAGLEQGQAGLQTSGGIEFEQAQQLVKFLEKGENFEKLTQDVQNLPESVFRLSIEQKLHYSVNLDTGDKAQKTAAKPTITYWIREAQQPLLEQTLEQIFAVVPKDQFTIDATVSKLIEIPFGEACQLCAKVLNDQTPQYYSPFTKHSFCVECAENDDKTQKGLKRYKVQDTVVFINAPLTDANVLKGIDEYKIGKNLKIKDDEDGVQQHPMGCNGGCGGQTEGPRYIALNVRHGPYRGDGFVDICQGCFEKLKVRGSDEAKKIIERNEEEGLTDDAVLLRILFNHGYRDY